jgi:hypothetical protein
MPRGSPAIKMAISIDRDVHAKVLQAVNAEGGSISAWMTEAARHLLRVREGLQAVAEWEAKHGELTSEELQSARQRVEGRSERAPRRKRSK